MNIQTMIKALYAAGTVLLLSACETEPDYKMVRKQVLDQHDQLMMAGEKAMNNKMKLDTLGTTGLRRMKTQQPSLDTAVEQHQIQLLTKDLNDADDQMNEWMHNFKPEVDGKTNAEAVAYFTAERKKVEKLDSTYKMVLKASDTYLQKFHIQPEQPVKGMNHMKM